MRTRKFINCTITMDPPEAFDLSNMRMNGLALSGVSSDLQGVKEGVKFEVQDMYGAEGWMAHHKTDISRITGPVDGALMGGA